MFKNNYSGKSEKEQLAIFMSVSLQEAVETYTASPELAKQAVENPQAVVKLSRVYLEGIVDLWREIESKTATQVQTTPIVGEPAKTTQREDKTTQEYHCEKCGERIESNKVIDWCVKNFNGRVYCFKCQPKK